MLEDFCNYTNACTSFDTLIDLINISCDRLIFLITVSFLHILFSYFLSSNILMSCEGPFGITPSLFLSRSIYNLSREDGSRI